MVPPRRPSASLCPAFRSAALATLVLAAWSCGSDTTDPGDTTPPAVTGSTPAADAANVPVSTTVSVTFSESIDGASVTASSFTLTGPGGPVSGGASVAGSTATFTPGSSLAGDASYTATVTTAVRDLAGNALAATHQWSFSTIETTQPTVATVAPAADATDVPLEATMSVTFSGAVDPATVTSATFTVTGPAGPVAGTLAVDDDEVTFTPTDLLTEFTTEYTVMLTTGILDLNGNALAGEATSMFTTVLVHRGYWYRLSNLQLGDDRSLDTRSNGSEACFMTTTGGFTGQRWRFTATRAGKYLLSNLFRGSSSLLEGGDGVNPCLLTGGAFTGQVWTLVPVAAGGIYRLQNAFLGTARSLGTDEGADVPYMATTADVGGQHWKLRRIVKIETTPPTVVSTTPTGGATDVGIASVVEVTFSEPVDHRTLTASTFTVTGPDGPVPGTVSVSDAVATFTPDDPLTEFTSAYTASVTSDVLDRSGNALDADHSWNFATVFVDPGFWYRLSNALLGDDRSLDTSSGPPNACFMGTTGNFTGQFWAFTEEPPPPDQQLTHVYRLTNQFGGAALSLDGDGSAACHLSASDNFDEQLWTVTPAIDGYYKLQNLEFGTARSLDTQAGTDVPLMAVTGGGGGQNWKIRRVGPM